MYHGRLMVQRQPITRLHFEPGIPSLPSAPFWQLLLCSRPIRLVSPLLETARECQMFHASGSLRCAGIHLDPALTWKNIRPHTTECTAQPTEHSSPLLLQRDYPPSQHLLLRPITAIARVLRNRENYSLSTISLTDMHATRRLA